MSEANEAAADSTKAAEQTEPKTAADTLYADKTEAQQTEKESAVESTDSVEATEEKETATADESETDSKETSEAEMPPDKYEFEVDDDSPVTDEHLDKIAQYAKERGLSQEAAQKLVDLQADTLKSERENQLAEFKKTAEGWKESAKADKEIGGDGFSRNIELAKRVVDRFGSESFKKALNDSGFGNHPELLRTFVRIANQMGEDTLVIPGTSASKSDKSFADLFYGSTNT